MDTLTKKKSARLRYLNALYDAVDGREHTMYQWVELGKQAGLDPQESTDVARYLHSEGLLKLAGQLVSLTHRGIKEIEYAREHPNEQTQYFPPVVNVISIGSVTNSQIQQGTHGSSQTATFATGDISKLEAALQDVVGSMERLGLAPERERELSADIATLQAQLQAPTPKANIVRELATSVRNILEEGSGGILAELTMKYGQFLVPFL